MTCSMMLLEQPTVAFSGESRYMTRLWVSVDVESREEIGRSCPSHSTAVGFSVQGDSLYHRKITYKIRAALTRLSLREQHVIVQFWSPRVVGKHLLLTTVDQPFGLGVVNSELRSYRMDSEHRAYHLDKNHEEQQRLSPAARVYMQGLPEWTSDVINYTKKDFPQQDCAICSNLHGYLALPVFDPTTGLCVGVLELLTCSKLEDFAYEVEHIHGVVKKGDLRSPQAFEASVGPALHVSSERSKNGSDKIFDILKRVCDTHWLPFAQTWTMSPSTSYFAHENALQRSCCSFNTRCLGKVCISTASLYYVLDVNTWSFMKASKKCHLEMSRGVAGRVMSSHGSCFCLDVTKLDEEEYPLVDAARMCKLTGCFAIFLHSVERDSNDYVLEFFLPVDMKAITHVMSLVHTLKQSIKAASGFELGDWSSIEVIGPPMDLSLNKTDSSDLESVVIMGDNFTVEKSNFLKEDRKRKRDSNTILSTGTVMVNVTFNKVIERFSFPLFRGLSKLKKKVAKRLKLEGQGLQLKYIDEDDDLILVCDNEALKFALDASGDDSSMNLICSKIVRYD